MKFWNQTIEFKSVVISIIATVVAFLGTLCLFWFGHYEIPLAILTSGLVVICTWLAVLIYYKRTAKPKIKIDVLCIYLRLILIVAIATIFTVLEMTIQVVIISPIYLIVGYFGISLCTLLALIRKDQ